MTGTETQQLFGSQEFVDCVEIYMPKSLEFLSELYHLLRELVSNRVSRFVLDGFSVYEVDGVFSGEHLWEQRTLVIRIMFIRAPHKRVEPLEARIRRLGRELAVRVAPGEEQIWICHYVQALNIFQGGKRLLS